MARRYAVYKQGGETISHYARRQLAEEWVKRGMAEIIAPYQIRLVDLCREVVKSSNLLSCAQSDAYELSAIESHCHLVQGGRVNGHRGGEARFNRRFSAATVGHQP